MTSAPAVAGVIGGGRMGAGVAQVSATAGALVTVVESDRRPRHRAASPPAWGGPRSATRSTSPRSGCSAG
ncbi:3-hydroxyacyl-CoA dehydrogenase NAD-binding domain-containing protein [Streptomyces minutiscleroticus]|uniref:3-hydroxyacyl-CoA dehydrogenase NAD-binding domain-containing protein n=1 Tax=Streptomyces minutiscleroticus TaxID=68238 RepID=UPI001E43C9C6|nr:3-hydroxyacyl-CoA dehydrogenase NAD-binding domain-containing protein [Streptomyces minutiscleroticus]